jgi:hypothetical protein
MFNKRIANRKSSRRRKIGDARYSSWKKKKALKLEENNLRRKIKEE